MIQGYKSHVVLGVLSHHIASECESGLRTPVNACLWSENPIDL
ncbi:MAG: hypothetical protein ACI9OD_003766 [Limisphaerales bacterium]|jgi:hypothetical protein